MGHAGYRSKSDKRKQTRTPHEKARRSRTSRMRQRRRELGLIFGCHSEPYLVQVRKGVYEARYKRVTTLTAT